MDLIKLLECSLLLLALINPFSKMYLLSTLAVDAAGSRFTNTAIKSSIIAGAMLLIFLAAGHYLLVQTLHVQAYTFKIAGGAALFLRGVEALIKGAHFETRHRDRLERLSAANLAYPLIAGPAAITATVSFSPEYGLALTALALAAAVFANLAFILGFREISGILARRNIMGALIRVTGSTVAIIGVLSILDGIEKYLGGDMSGLFINTFIKFFFLLTPFFLLTTFLSMTRGMDVTQKKKIAVKVTLSMIVICIILFHIGNQIFAVFGITLDSFRIGTGILLILSAITLVQGPRGMQAPAEGEDISVVPLAIPVAVGPATIGALLVMGGELSGINEKAVGLSAIVTALLCVGLILFLSGLIERIVKVRGLTILSKITGLILAALAAQMIMTGIAGFLG